MIKPFQHVSLKIKKRVSVLEQQLATFKPYDLGSVLLNRLTPKKGYSVQRNIAYGLKARQRLDLYVAETQSAQVKPLIVFVHGGAWSHGDKADYVFVAEAFCRFGYDVAVLNYHLSPEHIFPSYVNDIAIALDFLEQQHSQLGVSVEKIALMGHSAGAFNIASLIYPPDPHSFKSRASIKAMIGIAGPYHFDYKGDALAQHAFDQAIPYQQVMPYYFVQNNQIQHYLLLAEQDKIVKDSNSYDFAAQLKSVGNHCEVIRVGRTGHISIMGSVASLFSPIFNTRRDILNALENAFKAG